MARYISDIYSSKDTGIKKAEEYGNVHEDIPAADLNKPSKDSYGNLDGFTFYNHKSMDLFNNKKGRDIFKSEGLSSKAILAAKVYAQRGTFMYLYTY